MNNILKPFFLTTLLLLIGLSPSLAKTFEKPKLDTIDYRVFIAADRAGVEHFGGECQYRLKVDTMFQRVNDFWNSGSDRFNYYFRYIPDLQLIYEGSSKTIEDFYRNNFQSPHYDVVLIIDAILDHDDESGGWYCGGGKDDINMVACRGRSKSDFEDIFDKGYRGIVHEFGHYRGVTDLYADRIYADKNPVNGIGYQADSCIMNNHHGTDRWSDYAVNIINHTALAKRTSRSYPNFFKEMFPERIHVTLKGKAKNKSGVKLRLYGSRARHNDLIATPYREYETTKKGDYVIEGVPDLYDSPAQPTHVDDLPWNRWFTFVLEAEYKGEKKYVWLPEYLVQNTYFENKDTFEVSITF